MTRFSDRPTMMAIGDSLYQGVRSLTISAELARNSPPAQVAATAGIPFTVPNPRIPIVFDLETIFRQGGILHLLGVVRDFALGNMKFWLSGEAWSQHEAFDNVAIGGATIASLFTDTYDDYWPRVRELSEKLRDDHAPNPAVLGELWYALNVCFTLNPLHRPEQARLTQIEQVAARRPRTLLVNIGSNEGLFHAAFMGAFDDATLNSVAEIPTKMAALADRLAQLPPEIEQIVFNSLIRPRTASNLMTREDFPTPTGEGYFAGYIPRIGDPTKEIPGATIKAFDELIRDVNAKTREVMQQRLGARFRFVDLYQASTEFDGKHFADRALEIDPDGHFHRLRNIPLNILFGIFVAGGLTGLDNMHPTVPGYAIVADRVLAAIGDGRRTDKNAAFKADSLLGDLPVSWPVAMLEFGLLGALGVFSGDAALT
jgi:hypothetical protein